MKQFEDYVKKAFQPGTSQSKFFFGLLFFVAGLLIVLLGFWKALFVFFMTSLGVFIGSAETLGKATAKLIDKVIPSKNHRVVYTQEDLERIKEAARKREVQKHDKCAKKKQENAPIQEEHN